MRQKIGRGGNRDVSRDERRAESASQKLKKTIRYSLAFILLIGLSIGLYIGIGEGQEDFVDLDEIDFVNKPFKGMAITKRFHPQEPQEVEEVAVESKEETTEKIEEKVEDVVDMPVAPEKDLATIIANAKPYVYTIDTDLEQGSGFLFNTKGDIVTNAHVVKDASYIVVTTSDGQELIGQVIGISDETDIALVRVLDLAGKEPMAMETSIVKKGIEVFALGSPNNIANTSTEGKILSVGKSFFEDYTYKDLYEMNAAIQQGSSGGPLIDAHTEKIVGINSLVLKDDPSIGYAIPIYTVIDQLNNWAKNAKLEPSSGEEDLPHGAGAYFEEELLSVFIKNYYALLPYALNEEDANYYTAYLQPGSQAEKEGERIVKQYKEEARIFDAIDPSIKSVEIMEEHASLAVTAKFIYHNQKTDEVYEIVQDANYVVIIDDYGDYQIEEIIIK